MCLFTYSSGTSSCQSRAVSSLDKLESAAIRALEDIGFENDPSSISVTRYLNCRYQGTDTCLMTASTSSFGSAPNFEEVFIDNYRREYGFELQGREVLVDDIRVRAVGKTSSSVTLRAARSEASAAVLPEPSEVASCFFDSSSVDTPVYHLTALPPGCILSGPAIIMQNVATVVLEPGCRALITADGNIEIEILECSAKIVSEDLDPIYLSIFAHRFMGIAEQMGRTLQRTSISVNIKERYQL